MQLQHINRLLRSDLGAAVRPARLDSFLDLLRQPSQPQRVIGAPAGNMQELGIPTAAVSGRGGDDSITAAVAPRAAAEPLMPATVWHTCRLGQQKH